MSSLQEPGSMQVPLATNGSNEPPDVPQDGDAPIGQRSRRLRVGGIALAILVVGAVVGYFVGHAVGDNSSKVNALNSQIASVQSQNSSLQSQNSSLQSQNSSLQSDNSSLQSQNAALLAAATPSTPSTGASGGSSTSTTGNTPFNHAGTVGSISITPTALTKTSSGGQSDTWTLTASVKNLGSSSADPFCAGGASLIDQQGRSFDATSVVGGARPNCGNSVQPGLTIAGYQVTFNTPSGDKPASLNLWGTVDNQGSASGTWSVP